MAGSANITSSSKSGTVATYIAVNTFKVNQAVVVFGLTGNVGLNFSSPRVVTAASGTQFSVGGFASGTVGSAGESGTGKDPFEWLGEEDTNGEWLAGGTTQYEGATYQVLGSRLTTGADPTPGQGQIYPTGRA